MSVPMYSFKSEGSSQIHRVRKPNEPATVLAIRWWFLCPAILLFFWLYTFVGVMTFGTSQMSRCLSKDTCSDSGELYSSLFYEPWAQNVKRLVDGASGSSLALLILRLVLYVTLNPTIVNPNLLSAYLAACTLMSFTSEMIQSFGLLTAVREDAFGVRSPIMQMIEWQVTVPFLFYLCIAMDIQREGLTIKDGLIIILGGWLGMIINVPIQIFNHNLVVGWICATLSMVLINGATMLILLMLT